VEFLFDVLNLSKLELCELDEHEFLLEEFDLEELNDDR
jgi:hypothetical protein